MPRSILFIAFSLVLLACASKPPALPPVRTSDLKIVNGRILVVSPEEDPSVFFAIRNRGMNPRKIIGGSCAGCQDVEIRRAVLRDGAMASDVLAEWEIPAGGAVAFAHRGLSLSLVGAKDLKAGDFVQIVLEFADGENVPFKAEVQQ